MDDINKSVKIQSQEARNKDLMTLKFASIKKQAREVRVGTQAASRYYKSMSGTGYMEPDIWSRSLWTIKSEKFILIFHHNIPKPRVDNQVLFGMLIYLILIIIVIAVDCDIACT